jgi:hypothetical protein
MPSSRLLRRVGLVRTEVSEEFGAFVIRVTRICEMGTISVASYGYRCSYFTDSFHLDG